MNKVKFGSLLGRKELIIVAVCFVVILAFLYYIFFTPNYYSGNSPKRFEISKGEALSTIAEKLEQEGIIPGAAKFKIAAFLYGAEKRIRAGRYNIPNGLSYLDLLDLFLYGNADFLKSFKVFDGTTTAALASRLQSELFIDSLQFMNALKDKSLIDSVSLKTSSLEGYLFAGRYYFYERSSPREIIKTMTDSLKKLLARTDVKNKIESLRYSLRQIITVASIVDAETNKYDEMPVIASVYYNRLKRGMKLQADPTVQYLMPGRWKRLSYEDLQIDSPYNTYKYYGLPPGPINNPGKEALLAAIFPEGNNYLFFVADGKGGHKFAGTFTEHLRLVKEYRAWLKEQETK